jgi:hypothetical protein
MTMMMMMMTMMMTTPTTMMMMMAMVGDHWRRYSLTNNQQVRGLTQHFFLLLLTNITKHQRWDVTNGS